MKDEIKLNVSFGRLDALAYMYVHFYFAPLTDKAIWAVWSFELDYIGVS